MQYLTNKRNIDQYMAWIWIHSTGKHWVYLPPLDAQGLSFFAMVLIISSFIVVADLNRQLLFTIIKPASSFRD